jgi:hypothetical protein
MISGDIGRWHRATLEKRALRDEGLAEMAAHPRFGEACLASITNGLALYDMNRLAAESVKDMARFFLGYLVLYIHAREGITFSTIQQVCKELGITSSGRAAALLIRLRMIRYIELDPQQGDRRAKRYRPTAAMEVAFRNGIHSDLAALAIIEPEAAAFAEQLDDPDVFRAYTMNVGAALLAMIADVTKTPVAYFAQHNAGMVVLNAIMASAPEKHIFPPKDPIPVSLAALATRFKVSRTHVLRLVRGAEKHGYLIRDEEQRTITIAEPLRQDIVRYFAALFIGFAVCTHRATLDLDAQRTRAAE